MSPAATNRIRAKGTVLGRATRLARASLRTLAYGLVVANSASAQSETPDRPPERLLLVRVTGGLFSIWRAPVDDLDQGIGTSASVGVRLSNGWFLGLAGRSTRYGPDSARISLRGLEGTLLRYGRPLSRFGLRGFRALYGARVGYSDVNWAANPLQDESGVEGALVLGTALSLNPYLSLELASELLCQYGFSNGLGLGTDIYLALAAGFRIR